MGKRKLVRKLVRGWIRFRFISLDNRSLPRIPKRIVKSAKLYIIQRGYDPSPTFRKLRMILKIGGESGLI